MIIVLIVIIKLAIIVKGIFHYRPSLHITLYCHILRLKNETRNVNYVNIKVAYKTTPTVEHTSPHPISSTINNNRHIVI